MVGGRWGTSETTPPPPRTQATTKPARLSRDRSIAIGIIAVSAILVAVALLFSGAGLIKKEPRWIQFEFLKNDDNSYDFFVAFTDENNNEMTGIEGTGHLTITYKSQILYDSDYTIRSTDYTRKMPGIGPQPTCAFIHIPAEDVKKPSEIAFTGRARVDFTTKAGRRFTAVEIDVALPSP